MISGDPLFARPSRCSRPARGGNDFEEGLSLEEMLRLAKARQTPATPFDDHRQRGKRVSLDVPCVFTTKEQPKHLLGDPVNLRFIQPCYQKLRNFINAKTAGACAVRYRCDGAKSSQAAALWPSSVFADSMMGLNLGFFDYDVVTMHPFPVIRILATLDPTDDLEIFNPQEVHMYLRSCRSDAQRDSIADMSEAQRLALMKWLVTGGSITSIL